jgi:hypothetical protein
MFMKDEKWEVKGWNMSAVVIPLREEPCVRRPWINTFV